MFKSPNNGLGCELGSEHQVSTNLKFQLSEQEPSLTSFNLLSFFEINILELLIILYLI